MSRPLLIIISGPPCTGKTNLGKQIASEFQLPFVSKDAIKELLFDNLGWKDREQSKKLGVATLPLLYYFVETQLSASRSHIVESNFKADSATEIFLALKRKYDFVPFQIQCKTEGEVLFQRYKARWESGERHPGHVDHLTYEELKPVLLKGYHENLEIGGKILELDTTDLAAIDYGSLFRTIREAINQSEK